MTDHASMIISPAVVYQIRGIAPNVRVEVAAGRLVAALSAEAESRFLETKVLGTSTSAVW
jgi:hypothetical protein